MSQCRICGAESACYRPAARNILCADCAKDTPAKVTLSEFSEKYFSGENPPLATVREFYADYLASTCTLEEYIRQTTSAI